MAGFTDDDARRAVEDVRRGGSLRKASMTWGIPRSTLARRVQGGRPHSEANIDHQRVTPAQERAIANWAWVEAQIGRPPTRIRMREVAQQILIAAGDHKPLGKNWISGFLFRNPSVKDIRSKPKKTDDAAANDASGEYLHEPVFALMDDEGSESPATSQPRPTG